MAPVLSSIGIGGGGYGAAPAAPIAPSWAYAEAGPMGAAKRVREREASRHGRMSTILTSGLGDTSAPPVRMQSLLGS